MLEQNRPHWHQSLLVNQSLQHCNRITFRKLGPLSFRSWIVPTVVILVTGVDVLWGVDDRPSDLWTYRTTLSISRNDGFASNCRSCWPICCVPFSEHRVVGRLWPAKDARHGLVWPRDAGPTQEHQGLLRHEDPRQTKGTSARRPSACWLIFFRCERGYSIFRTGSRQILGFTAY